MSQFRISPRASADLIEIWSYIADDSVANADAFKGLMVFGHIVNSRMLVIPHVLKRSDTLTMCKEHLQLELRAGALRRFYSVFRPWPSRSCFIGWARISGKGELLGGAFSTCY